MYKLMMVNL